MNDNLRDTTQEHSRRSLSRTVPRPSRPVGRIVLGAALLSLCILSPAAPAAVDRATLPEINLHAGDARRLAVFANLMQQTGGIIMGENPEWAEAVQLDAEGWVKTPLPAGIGLWYLPAIQTGDHAYLPGVYVMTWDGTGAIALNGSSRKHEILLDDRANRRMVVRLPEGQGALIDVRSSDPDGTGDYIRNIKLWPPRAMFGGRELTPDSDLSPGKVADNLEPAPGQPAPKYHPFFEQHMRSVRADVWRPMGINTINQADPRALAAAAAWDHRRPSSYRTYQYKKGGAFPEIPGNVKASLQGMSYEQQLDIANDFDIDIWINLPHTASKPFIESLAGLCAGRLGRGRRVWVELSNETWNSYAPYLPQTTLARQTAADHLGLALAQVDHVGRQHGWGSGKLQGEALKTFVDALTAAGQPADRVVKVLAGFTGSATYNTAMMDAAEEIRPGLADVFAVTHYWGHSVSFIDLDYAHPTEALWQQVFERLEPCIYTDFDHAATAKAAAAHNLPVVAYEGSHHVTAGGNSANKEYVAFLRAMQYRPEMGALHLAQWAYWRAQGLATAAAFVDVNGNHLSFGQWGFKEFVTQTDAEAPKWKALRQWLHLQEGVRNLGAAKGAAPLFTTETLPSPEVGQPYTARIATRPGDGRNTIALLGGSLPEGLTLKDNGDGTATVAGTVTSLKRSRFTLRALDADKDPAYRTLALVPEPAGRSNALVAFRGSLIPGGDYGQSANRRYDFRRPRSDTPGRSYLPFGIGADDYWFGEEYNGKPGRIAPSDPVNLYGGWSITGGRHNAFPALLDGRFRSWHGTSPDEPGGQPEPSVFDACIVMTKAQFAGQPAKAWFGQADSECGLLAEIVQFDGDEPVARFVVLNGDQWYLSEAAQNGKGLFVLTGFNQSDQAGKRWGRFNPSAASFAIPDPLPAMAAVAFDDVRAFGLALKDRRRGYNYAFHLERLMAMGLTEL